MWVNGRFVREHFGGFTTWDCEITEFVTPGRKAVLAVGVIDRTDDMSYGSGYAHHPIGGILRDVHMLCLPDNYIKSLHTDTTFDKTYTDVVLHLETEFSSAGSAKLNLQLTDPSGNSVDIQPASVQLTPDKTTTSVKIGVNSPLKWDGEHPNLYTLTAGLISNGKTTETILRPVSYTHLTLPTIYSV